MKLGEVKGLGVATGQVKVKGLGEGGQNSIRSRQYPGTSPLATNATKTIGDSNFPNRPALGQLNLIE